MPIAPKSIQTVVTHAHPEMETTSTTSQPEVIPGPAQSNRASKSSEPEPVPNRAAGNGKRKRQPPTRSSDFVDGTSIELVPPSPEDKLKAEKAMKGEGVDKMTGKGVNEGVEEPEVGGQSSDQVDVAAKRRRAEIAPREFEVQRTMEREEMMS